MIRDDCSRERVIGEPKTTEPYEHPEIVDFGTLTELTRSGNAPLSDAFGGAAGGGS